MTPQENASLPSKGVNVLLKFLKNSFILNFRLSIILINILWKSYLIHFDKLEYLTII